MPITKICAICVKPFIPKTPRHIFCSRKCFNINYSRKKRPKEYPNYICPSCGKKTRLTFFPRLSRAKWSQFECLGCSKGNQEDDYREIQSIKLSLKLENSIGD